MVWPEAIAASTSRRLPSSAVRAEAFTPTRVLASRATRTTSSTVSERPSSMQSVRGLPLARVAWRPEAAAAVHLEHVPVPRNRQDAGRPVGAVGGEVDRGQIFHRIVVIVVLHAGAGPNGCEVQIAHVVAVDEEVDVRASAGAHQAELV